MNVGRDDDGLVCHSYTRGRRHPMVVGRIGGWALPTPLSPAQLLAGLGTFSALAATAGVWQPATPGVAKIVVLAGVPVAAGWAIRHARVEGRSPLRAAVGWLRLVLSPAAGVVRGRAHPRPRTVRLRAGVPVQSTGAAATAAKRPAVPTGGNVPPGRSRWSCLDTAA